MSARATNLAILALLLAQLTSGVGGFLTGEPSGRWVFWAHSVGGFALVLLITWKWRIVARSFVRRGGGLWAAPSVLLGALFLGSLATGLLWSTVGLRDVPVPGAGPVSGLTLHVALSVLLVPPFVVHAAARWVRPRRRDLAGRRAVLRQAALLAGAVAAWRATEAGARALRLDGATRRFTGSREEASFAGNAHPLTNWLTDRTRRLDPAAWRLRVAGAVGRPLERRYDELLAAAPAEVEAVLDCTGGWYTAQRWRGVRLVDLVAAARPVPGARSVRVVSATGYSRRFAFEEAGRLLLATHVEGEPLSPGHGFPLRLVAPGHRGYHWVKWVTSVEVSERPAWWQPPLPLQ